MRIGALALCCLLLLTGCPPCPSQQIQPVTGVKPMAVKVDTNQLLKTLVAKHGPKQQQRIQRGLQQVLARWRAEDGDGNTLLRFVVKHFISNEEALSATFAHLQYSMEMLDGHHNEIDREISRYQSLDGGPVRPVDGLLAAYSPGAHVLEDMFRSKIAFVVLLNFPLTTLQQRLGDGKKWSRRQWAEARLAARFEHRIPADVLQQIDRVNSTVESYIDNYNIQMDRLLPADGKTPFRKGLKLISHWGLRDEIRGQYARGAAGLAKQRQIMQVMERIIHQQLPQVVINSGEVEWDPAKNRVRSTGGAWREAPREPDTRYRHLLSVFQAYRKADAYYSGSEATYIDRVFNVSREIPMQKMRKLLTDVLSAPVAQKIGALMARRLGRKLEPFDLWYTGFRPRSNASEQQLDQLVRERYPTVKDFQKDIPRILGQLGFSAETAAFLGQQIVVDAARGAGHAHGAQHRDGKAHLRTRLSPGGMDYKGFNIAIHELGHNVEQVFSMSRIDHTELEGVPNTGFTEAFAFLFQAHDLELLGQAAADPDAAALRDLNRFWHTFEIAGVALLDMELWQWMYKHPDATPARLREATVRLARELWNRYYAPVFGVKDAILPAIYSHVIAFGLYTPDYPLGFLITHQVEQYVKSRKMAEQMERMCKLGRLAPDVWMQQAVGSEISAQPLLRSAKQAMGKLGTRN